MELGRRVIPPNPWVPYAAFLLALLVRLAVAWERGLDAPFEGLGSGTVYAWIVAQLSEWVGPEFRWIRVLQAVVGATGVALVTAATGRLFSRGAAWMAGLVAACYAPWIRSDLLLAEGSFALFAVAAFAWCLASEASVWRALGAGLALGLWTIFREHALLVGIALLPWIGRGHPGQALAAVAGIALALVPWIAQHRHADGAGYWPAAEVGVEFWIGNGERATGGPIELEGEPTALAEAATTRSLTPGGVSRYWLWRAVREAASRPRATAWAWSHKASRATSPFEPPDTAAEQRDVRDESFLLWLLGFPFGFAGVFVFGVVGALLADDSRRSALPLLVSVALIVFCLLLFYVTGRFRLDAIPLAIPIAAHGVIVFLQRFAEGGGRLRVVFAALIPIAVLTLPR